MSKSPINAAQCALDLSGVPQTISRMSVAVPLDASGPGRQPGYAAPFEILRPKTGALPLILASPHSGTIYPDRMRADLGVPLIELRRTEDAFVDLLFASAPRHGATLLTANYARGFVDLNRDPLELDPEMFIDGPPRKCGQPGPRVRAGLGCLPRVAARGQPMYRRRLRRAEGERRLADVHDTYHAALSQEVAGQLSGTGLAILIDCHSMPSSQPGRRQLADIVLGDRYGASCSGRLTSLVEREFRRLGYSVARNSPYAGGYTTLRYGRPAMGVHALQIEIRRDLYMDERRVAQASGFASIQADLDQVVSAIGRFVHQRLARQD